MPVGARQNDRFRLAFPISVTNWVKGRGVFFWTEETMDELNELNEMLERIETAPKQPLVRQIMQLLDGLTRQEINKPLYQNLWTDSGSGSFPSA